MNNQDPNGPDTALTPVWFAAVLSKMKYEQESFAETRAQFYQKNPTVRQVPVTSTVLFPPEPMLHFYVEQIHISRVSFNPV